MTTATGDMVQGWLTRAERDLATASWILEGPPVLHAGSLCHAECAAQKALKAYLASRGEVVKGEMELTDLLGHCQRWDEEFAQLTSAVDGLAPLAGRYALPGEHEAPELAESEIAMELAAGIVLFVRARL